jgi:hypothetical protein
MMLPLMVRFRRGLRRFQPPSPLEPLAGAEPPPLSKSVAGNRLGRQRIFRRRPSLLCITLSCRPRLDFTGCFANIPRSLVKNGNEE